ncbi:MAG TPA: GNAT family N-acetyltransferase [Gaiellaceae bacterium]|jgi:GNAT superfamily N-acetyltransferase
MDRTIREGRNDDLARLFEIQRSASTRAFARIFDPERHPYPDDDVRAYVRSLLADPETEHLVAEEDCRAVGFAAVSPGWLEQLYVLPEAQGRGVGGALLAAAVARRREAGDTELRLWTLEGNEPGRRFYEAHGWRLASETRVVPYPPHPIDVSYVLAL